MSLAAAFGAAPEGRARYRLLLVELTRGFNRWTVMGGAGARLPGLRSANGPRMDAMEGFSRLAPAWGAWLAGGGDDFGLSARLARGFATGPGAWGPVRARHQSLCEAADVALALWLARERVPPGVAGVVLDWLEPAPGLAHADNNWWLFPATVAAVLRAFGRVAPGTEAALERVRAWVTADGLFRDGPEGRVDWYSAWGFHYQLGWIERIAGATPWVREARAGAARAVAHLLSPHGPVLYGRSLHYRAAAPVPLVWDALLGGPTAPGGARRALDATWAWALADGLMRDGRVVQGDPRLLDAYAGPASPLWSLRGLIPALAAGAGEPFWTAPAEALPVEISDFSIGVGACRVEGQRASGHVTLRRPAPAGAVAPDPLPGPVARAWARARGWVARPAHTAWRYDQAEYSTRRPLGL